MISDTRHHHKRPLYFNISKFNGSKEKLKISRLSKACSKIVEDYVKHNEKVKEVELKGLIRLRYSLETEGTQGADNSATRCFAIFFTLTTSFLRTFEP